MQAESLLLSYCIYNPNVVKQLSHIKNSTLHILLMFVHVFVTVVKNLSCFG